MAYTRIHAIKATVHKSIDYICNPNKTEGNLLVSSFSCVPKDAHFAFKMALSKTSEKDKNLAYHLIQSFAPGEVSPEEAHMIGKELADRLLRGNYSYVIATHNDRKRLFILIISHITTRACVFSWNFCNSTSLYFELKPTAYSFYENFGAE